MLPMKTSSYLLALSRPLTYLAIVIIYMLEPKVPLAGMALYAFSAAFFLASSALLVGWLPALPRRWEKAAIWGEVVLVTTVVGYTVLSINSNGIQALYMPLIVTIPGVLDRPQWWAGFTAVICSWLVTSLPSIVAEGTGAIPAVVIYGAALLFFGSAGVLMRSLHDEQVRSARLLNEVTDSRSALERAHLQLQESASRQQQMAVLEERQRLAREIHDSVAHGLTALVVHLQAARKLMAIDPARAESTVTHCEEMAREALQDTRRAVRALHPSGLEQQADVEALSRLARDFGIATGMQVEVLADAAARSLPPDPERLEQLYRIFQEALTNAQRHGEAKSTRAELSVADGTLHLTMTNDGLPPSSLEPGVGLKSMAERCRALGGQIAFKQGEAGFVIRVAVPIRQEVAR
jgi:signal transduction histidine kinase